MCKYAPGAVAVTPRVNRQYGALASKLFGADVENIRIVDGGGVERNFVGPGVEHTADVGGRADAAADGQRHKNLLGHAADDIDHGVASVAGGGDVEEGQFVRALRLVGLGALHRIAGIAQFDELNAFDDAAAGYIQTRYDSFCQHRLRS